MDGTKTLSVGPLQVAHFTETGLLDHVSACVSKRQGAVITYAHAHTLFSSCKEDEFTNAIRSCDICYCDGVGVSLACAYLNGHWAPKVTANSYWRGLLELAYDSNWKIALVGGTPKVTASAALKCKTTCGVAPVLAQHGFFLGLGEEEAVVRRLASASPDLLILGLGQPQQERFAKRVETLLPNTVIICVGGFLDFLAGEDSLCPDFLRKAGLEWLFRLARSPRRLWRRYLLEVPWLMGAVLSGRVQQCRRRGPPPTKNSTGQSPSLAARP